MRARASWMGMLALWAVSTSACNRAAPPLPSFSRDHQKAPLPPPERRQNAFASIERCIDASHQDLLDPQYRDRARLTCRQAARSASTLLPEIQTQNDANGQSLERNLAALRDALAHQLPASPKIVSPRERLELILDKLHQDNDPKLVSSLASHAPRWHVSGMQLRLSLRRWRRCQEQLSSDTTQGCNSQTRASQDALKAFEADLARIVADQPFGARSFRRCAQRSFLPQPTQHPGLAQLAPNSPEALRSCERMASRIRWSSI